MELNKEKKNLSIWFLIGKILTKVLSILAKGTKVYLAVTSAALYTYIYGWKFMIVIMISLFIHEYGHVWAMKYKGIPTKGFYFIPLLGGAAVPERAFKSRGEEFFVAIMGPIFGLSLALFTSLIYLLTQDPMYAAVSCWMAIINIFNLLPINPLDGGRMMKSILYSINEKLGQIFLYLGIIALILLLVVLKAYILSFILFVSILELVVDRNRKLQLVPLRKKEIFLHCTYYLAIVGMLLFVCLQMKNIPGSDLAFKLITND